MTRASGRGGVCPGRWGAWVGVLGILLALGDLRGKRFGIFSGLRACLAEPWLEVSLSDAGLPPAANYFEVVERDLKLTRVVLPVYFGKLDACLATQSGFDTMKELNPKLGREMTVVLRSEPMVPMILAFRADYEPPYFSLLEKAVLSLHTSTVGRQMLTIFQFDRLESRPVSALEPSLELLRRREAISGGAGSGSAKAGP